MEHGQETGWRRAPDSRSAAPLHLGASTDTDPDATIQAINGHLSRKMLEHYSHVRLEAKRRAVEALDAVQAVQ